MIARGEHDNIVAIHHVGEGYGHSYMVLEYVVGVTLRQWIEQRCRATNRPVLGAGAAHPTMIARASTTTENC